MSGSRPSGTRTSGKGTAAKPSPARKSAAKKKKTGTAAGTARKKAAAKSKTSTAKKSPAAKKMAARKSSARKSTTTARTSSTRKTSGSSTRKTTARKSTGAKRTASSRSRGTTSTRISAAGKSLGEQIYRNVEEVVGTGKTAKDAFVVVARQRGMTASNVQQHYYRFKRKAGSRKTTKASKSRARGAQQRALSAVVQAGAVVAPVVSQASQRLPKDRIAALGKDVGKVREDLRDDLGDRAAEVVDAFYDLLQEARKNQRFGKHVRRIEKNLAQLLAR